MLGAAKFSVSLLGVAAALSCGATAQSNSPSSLDRAERYTAWSISALLAVRHVQSIAISPDGKQIAYIVRWSRPDESEERFELWAMAILGGSPRLLLRGSFLSTVEWSPDSKQVWLLAERGDGVQAYSVSSAGVARRVIFSNALITDGGSETDLHGSDGPIRKVGILGFGLSPDGKRVWYSRVSLKTPEEIRVENGLGIPRIDSAGMKPDASPIGRHELWVRDLNSGHDLLIESAEAKLTRNFAFFSPAYVRWLGNSSLDYMSPPSAERTGKGYERTTATISGTSFTLTRRPEAVGAVTSATRTYKVIGNPNFELMEVNGAASTVIGKVLFRRVDSVQVAGDDPLFGVRYPDRDGLAFSPDRASRPDLSRVSDDLSNCQVERHGKFAICVRQSINVPEDVARVDLSTGSVARVTDPNAVFRSIPLLHSEHRIWRTRRGGTFDGYITYPRNYEAGKAYPTIIATHAFDALNKFAWNGFQWAYPLQTFAERGYVVLSLNESKIDSISDIAHRQFAAPGRPVLPPEKMRELILEEPVDGVETAVHDLIDEGIVDSARVGIVGYSRGAQIVDLVMSRTALAKAGSSGDGGHLNTGIYWVEPFGVLRAQYREVFGGLPFEPQAYQNYREFSPGWRGSSFSGPLLQQNTRANRFGGEIMSSMLDAGIPTDLYQYPNESHLFSNPIHRNGVGEVNIAWFDFWLRDIESASPMLAGVIPRWRAMRASYKQTVSARTQ